MTSKPDRHEFIHFMTIYNVHYTYLFHFGCIDGAVIIIFYLFNCNYFYCTHLIGPGVIVHLISLSLYYRYTDGRVHQV